MGALDTIWAAIVWPFRQVVGFFSNVWTWLTDQLSLEDILLPTLYDSLLWLTNQIPSALGGASPGEMVESSGVLLVATFLTGIVTGGAAWTLIGVWLVTALVGIVRFVPVVEEYWPVPRFTIGDSRSVGVL